MNCAAYEIVWSIDVRREYRRVTALSLQQKTKNIAKRITADINTAYGIQVETQVISKVQRIIIDNIYQVENITGGISQSDDIPFSWCRASFVRVRFWAAALLQTLKRGIIWNLIRKAMSRHFVCRNCLKMRGFNSKITYRKGYNVVYIKGSEEIADILGYMGAAQRSV